MRQNADRREHPQLTLSLTPADTPITDDMRAYLEMLFGDAEPAETTPPLDTVSHDKRPPVRDTRPRGTRNVA